MAKRTEIPRQSIRLKERVESFLNSNLTAIKKIPPADIRNLFEDLQIYQTEIENHSKVWRESEERLNDFINSAPDSFVLYDSELNIIKVNDIHMAMFHPTMNKEDLIAKNLLDIVPNLKETGRYDDFMQVIQTGTPYFADDSLSLFDKFANLRTSFVHQQPVFF